MTQGVFVLFALPPMGEGLLEVDLVRWLVEPGSSVARGQSLMEVMSDKAMMEVPAPFRGTIQKLLATENTKIAIGATILDYSPTGSAMLIEEPTATPEPLTLVRQSVEIPREALQEVVAVKVAAAPSVRHLARQLGVDLATVSGTGPGGRVQLSDLAQFLQPSANGTPPKPKPIAPPANYGTPGTRVPLAGLRKIIAERMLSATRNIPHYSYIDECDFTELVRLRQQLKEPLQNQGISLTYLAFIVKAVAVALREVPIVNATFDDAKQEISLHETYHLGLAVSVPNGLVVPVIRDADSRDVVSIAQEIQRLGEKARQGKLSPEELRGSSFTITSVGGIGGLISTPILNAPEVGIMGVGKIVKRPTYTDAGELVPRDHGYLSFSFDHRIVDGAVGAAFGNAVIRRLLAPATLLLPTRPRAEA